ncbi:uncharacterized protein [Typha angustifolia]|uniref:uncharacterized protein n=1 Tax=Typha angustifolia TaxID=59011 RepID=UPI003C2D2DE3
MRYSWVLLIALSCFLCHHASAGKAKCRDPYYGKCYGIPLKCPPACPNLCEVDCKICKPYCDCDKPGAVCQDPRFIGGDGITFYFHGRKDKDFCLITDPDIHINAHFIGKKSSKGRDFTWVQSLGLLFGPHQLYIEAKKVAKWYQSDDNMKIQFNGADIKILTEDGETWLSPDKEVAIKRVGDENGIVAEVVGLFKMRARVVPITAEESRLHGYDIKDGVDCFAHLELSFKFSSLSSSVNGVLGQTYALGYRSRVKMGAPMPTMGGADKFASSHLFATDCAVSQFGSRREGVQQVHDLPVIACGSKDKDGGQGIVCRR